MHQLHVLSGPEKGRVFSLVDGQVLQIGRGQQSDTKINDPYMSRIHCRVEVNGNEVQLVDAGGNNTLVRGKPVQTRELQSGDEFTAGSTLFRYTFGDIAEERTVRIQAAVPPNAVGTAATPVASAPVASRPPSIRELIGHTFASYRLDSILASGSTGMVFKATDTDKNRIVAVKVLSPDRTSDDEEKERFIRAMKTMLPLRHRNLIRLWNAGKSGPYCWAAMEYVDGENLLQVIQRLGIDGMLDWRDVWRVGVDIASALHAAFEQKVIHRNVTPKNIIRRKSDRVCMLGDLMLAKALEGTLAKQVTSPGSIIGDLAYLPPERTRDSLEVDSRSDIYGLGATMYALLAGRPPFQEDNQMELIRAIRNNDPVRPSKYQLSIHVNFEDLVMKMLSKHSSERFQTPLELLHELERIGKYQGLVGESGLDFS